MAVVLGYSASVDSQPSTSKLSLLDMAVIAFYHDSHVQSRPINHYDPDRGNSAVNNLLIPQCRGNMTTLKGHL